MSPIFDNHAPGDPTETVLGTTPGRDMVYRNGGAESMFAFTAPGTAYRLVIDLTIPRSPARL